MTYGLMWHGKKAAQQLARTPSAATLRPSVADSVDWDTTQHLMIEGDNLDVLKLLQKSYAHQVKLIYIDPPYNTGQHFVYADKFDDTHWLSMIYPRLQLAKTLLRDDGAIFVSIDDGEHANLAALLREIFGAQNYVGAFIWEKRRSRENRRAFSVNHDYVLCAARNRAAFEASRGLLPLTEQARSRYRNPDDDPRGAWQSVAITAQAGHGTRAQFYTVITPSGRRIDPPSGNCWRFTQNRLAALVSDKRIWFGKKGSNVPRQKVFLCEQNAGLTPHTLWTADEVGTTDSAKRELNATFDGAAVFDTPKPTGLIRRILDIGSHADSLVLDFFAGSGTTAEAVYLANAADGGARRCILVQRPEPLDIADRKKRIAADFCVKIERPTNLAEITKERMRRCAAKLRSECPATLGDVGFRVFKLDASDCV